MTTKSGGKQAAKKPTGKKLANGLDPSIGRKTQFKPGQSGNPSGLKPGTKHINTWIQQIVTDPEFEARIVDPKVGVMDFKGAPLEAIIKSLAHIALTSSDMTVRLRAMDMLFKYGWPTKNELSGPEGVPVSALVEIVRNGSGSQPSQN